MPIGKDIFNVISKRHKARKVRQAQAGKEHGEPPAKVEQFKLNKVARASSTNVNIVDLVGGPRKVSPNEGTPAVNAIAGQEAKERFVHKPKLKDVKLDDTAGAITMTPQKGAAPKKAKSKDRKCGNCGESGHTKRTCTA